MSEDAPPRSAVAHGHITAAETALAKQIRAELNAELGLTPDGQILAAPTQQKGGRKKKEVVPLSEAAFEALLQTVCYDNSTRLFWKQTAEGTWLSLSQRDLVLHLKRKGMAERPGDDECISQVEEFICRMQEERFIHMCGDIGGHRAGYHTFGKTRILILNEPNFIDPVQGDWSMLEDIFQKMFGREQVPYIYGWIKVALDMFRQQSWMAGQVLALCGEKQSGKNLFTELLNHVFGGRSPGKPYSYMTQGTDFNSDFIGAELLTIEDEVSHTSIQSRRAFGAKIKDLAVNKNRRLHRKNAEALVVAPLQRLVISLNDEHERMRVLPPLESDIEDKIMLIKVFRHPMPMPTTTALEQKSFMAALIAQLPAFLHFLDCWQIPPKLVVSRFGIKHFHHPDLVAALQESDPEESLLELIDDVLFPADGSSEPWTGLANELVQKLNNSGSQRLFRGIGDALRDITQCGTYLGRLASKKPERIRKLSMSGGSQKWMIGAPCSEGCKKLQEHASKIQSVRKRIDEIKQAALRGADVGHVAHPKSTEEEVGDDHKVSLNACSPPDRQSVYVEGEGCPGDGVSGDAGKMEVACGPEPDLPAS
ncbi:DUF5906 domain-containing protein [Prosthecobacter dejongeii]|uniref:NrS-1 polymerase-like helicase domain-containing protein n=1 Tax=Prosthecobacter dejongeii TaxID=48465 RepID=A0A7W8DNJ3_9BACT|nr:hypothetical protein [Prosthecobacter dejongeii]MBB5036155.1 hypothetical protein [Prosthecobacter dejongeii]